MSINNMKPGATAKKREEENTMNNVIAKLFDQTSDAVLVEKYLGNNIPDTAVEFIRLDGKQDELIAEAKRLEEEKKRKSEITFNGSGGD